MPNDLQNAFVAVEDNRFYDHMGVDPRGIARAIYANLRGRTVTEGGSTITQQLAKNAYLTQDRTLKRKIQEVFLALQLERQYTKQEILELYLNQIYFGQGAYGVQAAAQTYFGKNVEDLDLDECAMLAGIPKSPNYYSPQNNLQAAQERKATVLDQMAKYGYITETEAAKTKKMEPTIVKPKPKDTTNQAAYFVDYVTQLMIDKYGADAVYKEGLKIYTTIDMDMQKAAEDAMKNLPNSRVDANGVQQPQGALVAIDPHNGYIKALENKGTPSTGIDDSPMKVGDWSPQNYNRTFNGKVTLRYVAEQSLNVPTVKIAQKLGIDKPIYYAQEMGISSFVLDGPQNDRNLSTALGGLTKGVTPLELVSAYGTFANKGVHVDPVAVTKVLDRNGKVLEQAEPKQRSVISEQSAAELTDMLQGVIQKGTGTRANIGRPAAGKTGTTSDYHDAWFVGYTPDLVAGVWIGSDDNSSLGGMSGGLTPAVIWKAFMSKALASTPPKNFDGSSAGGKSDAIGELENDKKSELKSDKKAANGKQDSAKSDGGKNAQQGGQQSQGGGNQQSAPAQAPAQQPAAPASNVPEPGGGVSKGRN